MAKLDQNSTKIHNKNKHLSISSFFCLSVILSLILSLSLSLSRALPCLALSFWSRLDLSSLVASCLVWPVLPLCLMQSRPTVDSCVQLHLWVYRSHLQCNAVLPFTVFVLFCLVLSCLHLVLRCIVLFVLSCLVLPYHILSYFLFILSCFVLYCLMCSSCLVYCLPPSFHL